jgi:uncharacterized repeat protein (TIGR03837 family)
MNARPARHWDLFCTVIDNYGDIGITWRLARQLAGEHGLSVRLWVDDLLSFHALRPEIDPERTTQSLERVEIRRWGTPFPDLAPADVVIEALACQLPENYVAAMARRDPRPVWINLEYLSAEDWVTGCHGLPSPHPRLPLTKWFFFPGYAAGTGGVLRESWLMERCQAFQASAEAQAQFWVGLGLPDRAQDELRISLFGYENRAVDRLLSAWADRSSRIRCLLPAGRLLADVARHFHRATLSPGDTPQQGQLSVHVLPMLSQDAYDRLLWACDCNFVRGEDSFVRAQWAGRPLVWQAYRQEEAAHWPKIEAYLNRYCDGWPADAAADLRALWSAWNAEAVEDIDWPAFWRHRPVLERNARQWVARLDGLGDLTGNLVQFCAEKL